jgi:putative hemolysin
MKWMIAILFIAAIALFGCIQSGDGVLVGNDSDIHGCKGSAGYSWCESLQKCIRVWEENCTAGNGTGIANPASVNCVNKGYNLTIRTDAEGGQYGICWKDGYSECEEWAFYRGECQIVAINATGLEPRAEGQFCGGIAAIPCQKGLHCKLDGTYPDAGGKCIKDCGCKLMTNGAAMGCFGCVYVKELGSFNCTSAPKGWQVYEKEPGAIGIPYTCYCASFGPVHATINGVNTTYAAHGGCELAQ